MGNQDGFSGADLARAHGIFNLAGGLWPLIHMSSFERVFGRKADRFLVQTVAGLLVGVGWSQLRAASSPEGVRHARRIGLATAATLLTIDLIYVPLGRLRPTHLLDAALEAAWIKVWYGPAGAPVARSAKTHRR